MHPSSHQHILRAFNKAENAFLKKDEAFSRVLKEAGSSENIQKNTSKGPKKVRPVGIQQFIAKI